MCASHVSPRARRPRIAVLVSDSTNERELDAFVRACVARIEDDLGVKQRWVIEVVALAGHGFESIARVDDRGVEVESRGTGLDGALATWDALCRLERALRQHRAARAGPTA